MKISSSDWLKYIRKLASINDRAASLMQSWMVKNGLGDVEAMIAYAQSLANRYGEAAASLACEMYDAVAAAQNAAVPPAEPAPTATYQETARAVRGTLKNQRSTVPGTVGRLVKQAGADTTLKNAARDGAQFAWVPHGDTCAFCLTLASNGWRYMSKDALRNGHAEHIHPHCDCTYAIRFGESGGVEGYDPDAYLEVYENAEGATPQEKINAIRRDQYAADPEKYRAQKRAAYAARKETNTTAAEALISTGGQVGGLSSGGDDGIIGGGGNDGGRNGSPPDRPSDEWQAKQISAAIKAQVNEAKSDGLVDAIIENHEGLRHYTPESMRQEFVSANYEVKPLGRGNYKGIPFEEGGGYRVNFGGDGLFQFHPEGRSHHDGAYWKVGNGRIGIRRYNLDGSEKQHKESESRD